METTVRIVRPPPDTPDGWDISDAIRAGWSVADLTRLIEAAEAPETAQLQPDDKGPRIADWLITRYNLDPVPIRWLVDGVIPLGTAGLLAATGDAGKSMLALDLAMKVTCYPEVSGGMLDVGPEALGSRIRAAGASVVFTAEDDFEEVNRRLKSLDPDRRHLRPGCRLYVVPLPSAGGPVPLVVGGRDNLRTTPEWASIVRQLLEIDDLKLLVFDPLSSFAHVEFNRDPAAAAYVTGMFASLATATGAAVMVCHHMTKENQEKPISNRRQAKAAVRGSSQLIDGMRWCYAFWEPPKKDAAEVLDVLGTRWQESAVFAGSLVKSNSPGDKRIRTYVRSSVGLLEDRTSELDKRAAETGADG